MPNHEKGDAGSDQPASIRTGRIDKEADDDGAADVTRKCAE